MDTYRVTSSIDLADYARIIGPDSIYLETLISFSMTSSNRASSHAENIFKYCKNVDLNTLVTKLLSHLQHSHHIDVRAMSAILLRTHLEAPLEKWDFDTGTYIEVKTGLLDCVVYEQSKTVNMQLFDTISELASCVLADNSWPELLPFVFECVSSEDFRLQESGLLLFVQLAQFVGDTLLAHITHLHDVFGRCLREGGSAGVRIAALSALISFIPCLESSSDRDRFQDLLIEVVGTEPSFLMRQWGEVVCSMLEIEAESLDEGTRLLGIEFEITLAEESKYDPGLMRKLPLFIRRLFAILMRMMLDFEAEVAWNSAKNEDEDAGASSSYSFGEKCLGRLVIVFGGDTIVPIAFDQLNAYLAAPEWQKHLVALLALAKIAEGCSKVIAEKSKMERVVTMVLNSVRDPHPGVRLAATKLIGHLSTHLGPDLQDRYHDRVIRALASAMDDFQNPRVQACAISAVSNFCEKCTPKIVNPRCLDGILTKLFVLMKHDEEMVREEAFTALDLVFDSPQEQFQKDYDAFMPYLKA